MGGRVRGEREPALLAVRGASLATALAVAFVVTLPIDRALMSRGKGHAVVHSMH